MEQNTNTGVPMTSTVDNKQKSGNGLKIATAIACIAAVCGIGFGVYGMMQSTQKESQISDLKTQMNNSNTATTVSAPEDEFADIGQPTRALVETAMDKEKSIAWPADIERLEGEPEVLVNKIVLPKIIITSEAAQSINNKIIDQYSKYLEDEQTFNKGPFSITTDYDSVVRDDILYLVISYVMNSYRATGSSGFDVYYYDIKNNTELSVQEVAKKYNIPQDATIIIPSVSDSFDYYYHDDNNCYRMGCEVIDNTF